VREHLAVVLVATGCGSPASADAPNDYGIHILELRAKLHGHKMDSFPLIVEKPFVVVGNDTQTVLARRVDTVKWAIGHFEKELFDHRPTKILDIYLFNTAASYEAGVKELTGEAPTTPYGFYSRSHEGLFMNISTGGGTLVHELVHPYVEADFPNAPPWLNEGLGSLFEQSNERDGKIVGLTNWRLSGLQRAIRRDAVPTFRQLTHMDSRTFYADDTGVNYAASRYLLYYMQEKGLLHSFYRAFKAARLKDPSGYATLQVALGEKDMAEFQSRWKHYVSELSFP
jgi:hypothetical protein